MRHAFLVMVLCLNTACGIVTYYPKNSAPRSESLPKSGEQFLTFSSIPAPTSRTEGKEQLPSLPLEMQLLKKMFEEHSRYQKVSPAPVPPANGLHVNHYQTDPDPPTNSAWCLVSLATLNVIPCYQDKILSQVHFDIYVDNVPKASYSYAISSKGFIWIGLLPFSWINYFTVQYEQAFGAVASQFIAEAHRDGYL